jgi:hypothetical protein
LRLNGAIGDDLGFLAELAHLRILGLESLKTSSVRGIEALRRVECLVIDHAPRLTSLDPIANLDELRHLSISTPASWDPARRCIEVDTLAPLGELARLEHLTLRGVRPSADGLRPLEPQGPAGRRHLACPGFRTRGFRAPRRRVAARGRNLPPAAFSHEFPVAVQRCRTTQEWLTGAVGRQKRYLCPVCDKDKLAAHVAAFERIKQAARAAPSARRLTS